MTAAPDVDLDDEDAGSLEWDTPDQAPAGLYAVAFPLYRRNGWTGTLPMPARAKWPPPTGYTGAGAPYPSFADCQAWTETRLTAYLPPRGDEPGKRIHWEGRDSNIALRLPESVLGIDVDCYGGKPGAATLADHEARLGTLPHTWTSSSRQDGSGIRLYLVPPGLKWPGELRGGGVELIQARHRYVVAPPSIHPDTGQPYAWRRPDNTPSGLLMPHVDRLPELPAAWVDALTGGVLAVDLPSSGWQAPQALAWFTDTRGNTAMCARMAAAALKAVAEITTSGASRHDAAGRATYAVASLHAEGHNGVAHALAQLRRAWDTATAPDDRAAEWERLWAGAGDKASAAGHDASLGDPCSNPFAPGGQLAGLLHTPPKGLTEWTRPTASSPSTPTASTSTAAGSCGPDSTRTAPSSTSATTTASTPTSSTPSSTPASHSADSAPAPSMTSDPAPPAAEPSDASAAMTATPSAPDATPTSPDEDDPYAELRAAYLMQEKARQWAIREARKQLDAEDALAQFRQPVWIRDLTDELALPEQPTRYRIDGLLPAGGNAIVAAQFKAGKTTVMNHLLRCLADDEPFLGEFDINPVPRRIAAWNYEVGTEQYRSWLREVGIRNTGRITHLPLRGYRIPLRSPRVEDWAVKWLVEHEIDVWVIDPLARAAVGSVDNENDNSQYAAFLDTIDVIKERAGVQETIIPVHTGRGGEERARGATRIDDWPDVAWTLVKNEDEERFFRAYGRDVDIPEGRLKYVRESRSLEYMKGEDRKTRGNGELCSAIIRVIGERPGLSQAELARSLGRNPRGEHGVELREALSALTSQGTVRKVELGAGRGAQLYLRADLAAGGAA